MKMPEKKLTINWAEDSKKESKEKKELSRDDVSKKYSDISWQIHSYWTHEHLTYKTSWKNGEEIEVTLSSAWSDGAEMSILTKNAEGYMTYYTLSPVFSKKSSIVWFELSAGDDENGVEHMKNLSPIQVMECLDKFNARLKEYKTQQFDKMQQYAATENEEADADLDNALGDIA